MKYTVLKRLLSIIIILIFISSIYIPNIISIENKTDYKLIIISPHVFSNSGKDISDMQVQYPDAR